MIKKTMLMLALIALAFPLSGCTKDEPGTVDKQQRQKTEQMIAEAERQVGMPNIKNFQERKLMKMILELRDQEDLVCYAYIVAKYSGELKFLGKCIGFGLPYSVQYTNPSKPEEVSVSGSGPNPAVTVAMPDPNGLFMPEGLSATWLMLIDPETGNARPVYIEPEIIVSPMKLHQD
ncbi:MAG: hypothetical protein Q8Q32_00895 [bacterium]|nr:hypothetical protein [bacterium]